MVVNLISRQDIKNNQTNNQNLQNDGKRLTLENEINYETIKKKKK